MTENSNNELQYLKEQLKIQEKMASLGMLSAGIAHEIQNPLNFIINFSRISEDLVSELEESLPGFESGEQNCNAEDLLETIRDLKCNLGKIRENGERASGIVRGILLYSRGKENEFIPTDLARLIHEYVNLSFHAMRANFKNFNVLINERYGELPLLNVVPQDISRAILNIMNNACYAVYEKSLQAGADYRPEINVSLENGNDRAVIIIEDNGTGIKEECRDKIFSPFFTTKPIDQGTGLGLSITKSIIEQKHNGTIAVESVPGEYCRFIISIPIK